MATTDNNQILRDFTPFFIQYKTGQIERPPGPNLDYSPPGLDPKTGVQSKDVVISPNVSARLFLPKNASPKLPLLIYTHGGGFVTCSAFCPLFTTHLNNIVLEANVIAVSIEYRIAPEFPLPIAYDDCWAGVEWIASHFKKDANLNLDDWIIEFADFERVFLGGDSAGGNIAHNLAIRFGKNKDKDDLKDLNLRGMFLNCPYFWGEERIGKEEEHYKVKAKFYHSDVWKVACPSSSGCDDPLINPSKNTELSMLGCKRVLVYVGSADFLSDRGWHYKEALEKCGWSGEIEVVEVEGEDHCWASISPETENAVAFVKHVAKFLNE